MAWSYNPKEFIKVYRKFMEWEWYTDVNTKTLFLHCLLRANWKPGSWKGINYKAGEFITSLPSLSEETGLTVRQVRTSLTKLISTGEVTSKTTDETTGRKLTRNRIIAVNNWDSYQVCDSQNDSQNDRISDRQATGKRQASDSRYKNNKNNKNIRNNKNIYKPAAQPFSTSENEVGKIYDEDGNEVIWK